jgi:hypothetical protein
MQIGCFVYQYAKLRMLEFYYNPRQQTIHVLVFGDLVGSLVDPLAAELVFLPETLYKLAVSFTSTPNCVCYSFITISLTSS